MIPHYYTKWQETDGGYGQEAKSFASDAIKHIAAVVSVLGPNPSFHVRLGGSGNAAPKGRVWLPRCPKLRFSSHFPEPYDSSPRGIYVYVVCGQNSLAPVLVRFASGDKYWKNRPTNESPCLIAEPYRQQIRLAILQMETQVFDYLQASLPKGIDRTRLQPADHAPALRGNGFAHRGPQVCGFTYPESCDGSPETLFGRTLATFLTAYEELVAKNHQLLAKVRAAWTHPDRM